jgi:glucose-6-phosphate isomerase
VIDLCRMSGLPVRLDDCMRLEFGEGVNPVEPDIRTLEQARNVFWNASAQGPQNLYFMYRDVHRPQDNALFSSRGIRYDITVIVPGFVGKEYVKTVGHFHPEVPGTGVQYPEVYEVLHGRAHYLLQKASPSGLSASDVVIVEATAGQKVLIPPGYGHITVNPGTEPLVMSNLIERTFKSIYGPVAAAHGGAYFEVMDDGDSMFVENENYEEVAEPRLVEPADFAEFGILAGKPLYTAFLEDCARFDFLVRPQDFAKAFARALDG